mgnify:CR=1 FL=1
MPKTKIPAQIRNHIRDAAFLQAMCQMYESGEMDLTAQYRWVFNKMHGASGGGGKSLMFYTSTNRCTILSNSYPSGRLETFSRIGAGDDDIPLLHLLSCFVSSQRIWKVGAEAFALHIRRRVAAFYHSTELDDQMLCRGFAGGG